MTVPIYVDEETAKKLQRLLARLQKTPKHTPRALPGGWVTTRGLAARLFITEGGCNGHLSRFGLHHAPEVKGRYCVTKKAVELGLGRDGKHGPEWRPTETAEYIKAQKYHK